MATTNGPAHAGDGAPKLASNAQGRLRWAQLLKRVFDIDIERCPRLGGQLKLIAAIEEPAAIARTGKTGGSVSGRVRGKTGLDFDRDGRGVRTERRQSLRWRENQAR